MKKRSRKKILQISSLLTVKYRFVSVMGNTPIKYFARIAEFNPMDWNTLESGCVARTGTHGTTFTFGTSATPWNKDILNPGQNHT